jgi:L-lactate dehydrogenase complex protein LldG
MVENHNSTSLGIPKDDFIDHVRRSLGRHRPQEPAPVHHPLAENLADLEARAVQARQRLDENRGELLDRFEASARVRNWNVFRTTNIEESLGYVVDLAGKLGVSQAARADQPVFAEVAVDSALRNAGVESIVAAHSESASRPRIREQIIESGLGITGADYAVAETGSVVVLPTKGLSRLVSLVPPVHLAIVRAEDLVESLDDVFLFRRLDYLRNGGDMGSYLNFITGPSRTADIEMKLVVGVHGPREVHLALLG